MKRLKTSTLIAILIASLIAIIGFQKNDIMTMNHWLELLGIEFVAQIIYNRLTEKSNETKNQ
jgi:hypothetical protein